MQTYADFTFKSTLRNWGDPIFEGWNVSYKEIFDEWREIMHKDLIKQTEIILDQKPDVLFLTGSGTLTLSNPEMVAEYSMPSIRVLTRMAKEAGIPSMLHCCGKTKSFIEMLSNTDLDCINPLEEPPMGDVTLQGIREKYGKRFCLMGNLHTTRVMLFGSVLEVEVAARKAIDDAGKEGAFILSTGDQCGRDTPYENIFKMIEVAKTYGKY